MASRAAGMAAILKLAIFCIPFIMGISASDVMRLNYGIKFHSLSGLYSSHEDFFAYTFIAKFPSTDYNVTVVAPDCVPVVVNATKRPFVDQCQKLISLVHKVYDDTDKVIDELVKTIDKVKAMVPAITDTDKQAVKRALLPFLGTAMKFLTGAPDKKSFNKLRSHVNWLEQDSTLLHDKLGQFGDTLNGFMQLENQNYHQLIKNLQNNNHQVTKQVTQWIRNIKSHFLSFVSY